MEANRERRQEGTFAGGVGESGEAGDPEGSEDDVGDGGEVRVEIDGRDDLRPAALIVCRYRRTDCSGRCQQKHGKQQAKRQRIGQET